MNKKLIWIVIGIIVITATGYFFLNASDLDNQESTNNQPTIDEIPEEQFNNLDSTDSVFNEIDSSLEFIE